MRSEFSFKYHPSKFDDMILDPKLRKSLETVLKDIPNVILAGPPGTGKSTFTDILIKENGFNVLRVNASDETGIDFIRDKVKMFSTGVNIDGKLKIVYLNECDSLSVQAQKMLRDLIEQVYDITRFILVCNYPEKIIPEIVSRCPIIDFGVHPPIKDLAMHCKIILDKENIEYDLKDLLRLVKTTGTDIRHTLNTLQLNIHDGKLSSDLDIKSTNEVYDLVIEAMKEKDPSKVRTVLRSSAIDYVRLYDYIYNVILDSEDDVFSNDMTVLLHVTEASYRNEFVSIKEINFMNFYLKMFKDGSI